MRYTVLVFCYCWLLAGCKGENTANTSAEQRSGELNQDTIPELPEKANDLLTGKIYDFSLTNDPGFCNRDSLVEGDCNSGYLYFTPKGNVIHRYLCVNSTEENYFIGKAEFNAKGLLIRFDQCYTYKVSEEYEDPALREINSGKMEKYAFEFQLVPLKNCPGSYGYATDGKNPEYYLVQEATNRSLKDYPLKEILEINALQKY